MVRASQLAAAGAGGLTAGAAIRFAASRAAAGIPGFPSADFTVSPLNPVVGAEVTFDGTLSEDPRGSIVGYDWSFGDGATATGSVVTHTYSSTGTFTVSLTVTDDDGNTDTASTTVTVSSGTATTLDDYEAADPLADYEGTLLTDRFEVQSNVVLQGTQTLHAIGTDGSAGYVPTGFGGRGFRYQGLVLAQTAAEGNIWFTLAAQDSGAILSDSYTLIVDWGAQDIHASVWNAGAPTQFDAVPITLSLDTLYIAEVDLLPVGQSPNLFFRLLDAQGSLIAEIAATDDSHTGGTFGWHYGGGIDGYMDLVTQQQL